MRRKYIKSPFATFCMIQLVCFSAILIINGCRKTDNLVATPETVIVNNVEQKFFTNNASIDPLVKTLNGFLRKKNDTLKFVEKTVKQIGYPRWNKAITISKPGNTSGRGNSGDSSTLTYIPFVRETENVVNASMIVETTPIDTIFQYICDWQYNQFPYSSVATDSTAENIALFFMFFTRQTLGQSQFHIIDNQLFANYSRLTDNNPIITIDEITESAGRNTLNNNETCFMTHYCPYANEDDCNDQSTSCDYLNCSAEPDVCYPYLFCINFPGGDPGGGGGGTGDGSGGNGGATGGGTGNGTPSECDPGPTNGNRTEINNTCGPGWNPVPIDDDPPFSPNQIIIDSLQGYPCAQGVLLQLPSVNSQIIKLLDSVFFINENTELFFKPKLNFTKDSIDGYTDIPSGSASFFRTTIFMNPWMLSNSTKEYIAASLIHESIHAYINFWYYQYKVNHIIDSSQFKQMFPIFWDYYRNDGFYYQPSQSHNEMAERYVVMMKDFIKTFSPSISDTMANAIAWGGLQKTSVWKNKTDTNNIYDLNHIARQDIDSITNSQYLNHNLKKCN